LRIGDADSTHSQLAGRVNVNSLTLNVAGGSAAQRLFKAKDKIATQPSRETVFMLVW